MTPEESIAKNCREVFELPADCVEFLLMVWDVIQFFDDVIDGDEFTREDVNAALWNSLVGLQSNRFYRENIGEITSCLSVAILKWHASDIIEKTNGPDEKCYMWRAGFYDVILCAIKICKGAQFAHDIAPSVLELYGESYEEYKKDFETEGGKCRTQSMPLWEARRY